MIIDTHTHIGKFGLTAKLDFSGVLKALLKEMRISRIDHALVIAGHRKTNFNIKMADELRLIKRVKNLSAVGSLDVLNYKNMDLEILGALLQKKIIKGIKIHLGYQHIYPNEEKCYPIYKLCLKYDVPVIFHTGDTLTIPGEIPVKVKYAHPLPIDDVAADLPDLKIIIAHLGNPWLTDCAEVLYKNQNVYADISGLFIHDADLKSSYGELMRKKIKELCDYSSPRKLLYGTDWPLASMKSYIKFTKNLGLAKKDLDYVFYKNALELFKI